MWGDDCHEWHFFADFYLFRKLYSVLNTSIWYVIKIHESCGMISTWNCRLCMKTRHWRAYCFHVLTWAFHFSSNDPFTQLELNNSWPKSLLNLNLMQKKKKTIGKKNIFEKYIKRLVKKWNIHIHRLMIVTLIYSIVRHQSWPNEWNWIRKLANSLIMPFLTDGC